MSIRTTPVVDAVLFDLDGTIVNTIPHILASFRHATCAVFGAPLPDHELLEHVGIPLETQMRLFTAEEELAQRLLAEYRTFNRATHDEMALLYPNTVPVLDCIAAAGLPMGIVTSKSRMMAERALGLFGLGHYFRAVVAADDTQYHKPHPEPVLLGARLLGVDPARCVYIGDSPMDIAAGKAAGTMTVGASWGVSDLERITAAEPNTVLTDIGDVPDVLGIACMTVLGRML